MKVAKFYFEVKYVNYMVLTFTVKSIGTIGDFAFYFGNHLALSEMKGVMLHSFQDLSPVQSSSMVPVDSKKSFMEVLLHGMIFPKITQPSS